MRILLVLLIACGGRPDQSSPSLEQPTRTSSKPSGSGQSPRSAGFEESYAVRYAAKTEASAAGPNENYFSIIEDESLFILADAARLPGDVSKRVPLDASKLAVEAMSPYTPDACPPSNASVEEAQLTCALGRANAKLLSAGAGTASIAAVTVRGHQALVGSSGDISVLWIHGGVIDVLAPTANRSRIGTSTTPQFGVRWINLNVPTGPSETTKLEEAIALLVEEAKQVPGHGALTSIFVHLVHRRSDKT